MCRCPQWTRDEKLCTCNINNETHFCVCVKCAGVHSGREMRNCVHVTSTMKFTSMRTTTLVTYSFMSSLKHCYLCELALTWSVFSPSMPTINSVPGSSFVHFSCFIVTPKKWIDNVKEDMEKRKYISNNRWPVHRTDSSGDIWWQPPHHFKNDVRERKKKGRIHKLCRFTDILCLLQTEMLSYTRKLIFPRRRIPSALHQQWFALSGCFLFYSLLYISIRWLVRAVVCLHAAPCVQLFTRTAYGQWMAT